MTEHVLFVANFPAGTGYAWNTIDRVYGLLARRLESEGHARVSTAAPAHESPDGVWSAADLRALTRRIRREGVTLVYLTDQRTWSWWYPIFRLAGAGAVIVHDRTSGERTPGGPVRHGIKALLHRVPGLGADRVIAISAFVRRRLRDVNGVPADRLRLVYNGVEIERFAGEPRGLLQSVLGVPRDTPVVFASGRAQPYKGIPVLIEAASRLPRTTFAYCGDGPALSAFREQAARLGLANFHFLGRRDDVPELLRDAAIAVVPAVWAEAFGLTVVEAMAAGVPVIASRVGGIPELVQEGITGLLVPAGDPAALASAITGLLDDPARRAALGAGGRRAARERFTIDRTVVGIYDVVAELLSR